MSVCTTASPTRRWIRTVAAPTGPSRPAATLPDRLARPGRLSIVVVTLPSTPATPTLVKSGSVVVVSSTTGAGGRAFECDPEQAATRATIATSGTARARRRTPVTLRAGGPRSAPL